MKISTAVFQVTLAILLICAVSSVSSASILDVTVFGGFQNPGKLTFETAPGSATNLITNFDPHTFGVFGARLGHGGLIGGEHTIAYAANFLNSDTHAFIYHSNLRVMPTFGFVKPYATAGVGGGVTLAGPVVGLNLDVRGYAVPKISVAGYTTQPRLDFIQASAGINFHF